ncbi:hypothetical protein [Spiroplasma culicicola]|uniref:Uncharacterized protein n=1 Tax=Spiroplasma culicicola AES-1 TaxID=1276246 RepID=W6A760_9MOLU|nr:hypothetical protein [Spiroplasma culicicola]AHI52811.1 hypothetical protein SCULI_v1c04700 [Spiroplasma culicicola AES-1]
MNQKNKKTLSADQTAELAFEELMELSKQHLENEEEIKEQKHSYINIKDDQKVGQTDLLSIINNVKNKNSRPQGWVDPEQQEEENIINKAKAAGKSEYDSDVLRELILKRQKERHADKAGFGNLLSNVRQKKDEYNK